MNLKLQVQLSCMIVNWCSGFGVGTQRDLIITILNFQVSHYLEAFCFWLKITKEVPLTFLKSL